MKKTRMFEVEELKKACALEVFLITRNLRCNICMDYIYDSWDGEDIQVYFVKYEKKAQKYVEAWEVFMDVQYVG